ncbi:hypothetical protein CDIK_3615, partial [Cucumispora dikerogammari]
MYVFSTIFFEFTFSLLFFVFPYIIGLGFVITDFDVRFVVGFICGLVACVSLSFGFSMVISAWFCNSYTAKFFVLIYCSVCFIVETNSEFGSQNKINLFLEKLNPLRYGKCLTYKIGLDDATKKYFLDGFLKIKADSFYVTWKMIVLL